MSPRIKHTIAIDALNPLFFITSSPALISYQDNIARNNKKSKYKFGGILVFEDFAY